MSASSRFTWQLVPISALLLWSGLALRAVDWTLWWLALGLQLAAVFWAKQASGLGRFLTLAPWLLALMRPPSSQPVRGGGWLSQAGAATREVVARAANGVSQPAKALTLGITDGDVSGISTDLGNLFKSMSLTHLTAVSGANCAILIGVLVVLAKQLGLGRTARTISCIGVLAAYLLLVGDQPSVLRAAIMAAVTLIATGRGNTTSTVHLLALAVISVLTVDPSFALSLGFALSVLATGGVVLLAPRLTPRLNVWLPQWLASSVAVALAAQLCCLPLLVGLQSNPSSASLLANLLAEPAVGPITVMGLMGAVLALVPFGLGLWLSAAVFWIASLPAAYIIGVAQWLNDTLPNLAMPVGIFGFGFALLILLAVILLTATRQPWPRIGGLALLLAACVFILGSGSHMPIGRYPGANWVMVACDVGQGDATVLRAGGEVAVVDVGKDPRLVDQCLRRLGVRRISLLVLTHFDLDHVGGLSGAIARRRVDQALVTQFVDARPGAAAVASLLRQQRIPVKAVAQGVAGNLGAANSDASLGWLVLSPHPGGADAASSNEGSVAMFWHGSRFNVFTMADLPAIGQQRVMDERSTWWREEYASVPTILKLSHHGSADQDPEFLRWVHPLITTISVGKGNPYGHPTRKALVWLNTSSASTLRTDQLGSIAISATAKSLAWSGSGAR